MKTRSLGLALVVLLLTCGVAWAGKEAYRLVISQDKELCPIMLKLINDDLREHGEIRYEDHEMFAAVKWQPLSNLLGGKYQNAPCEIQNAARFDVNNDGSQDLVVKYTGCFKSRLLDWFIFLDVEEDVFKTYDDDTIEKNTVGKFPEDATALPTYILKTQVPVKDRTKDKLGLTLMSEGVGGWIVINPFVYKTTAYLAITDRGVLGTSPHGESFLIGKYKSPTELDEVCYLKQTRLTKKQGR
ncbi:MAG: hypothetical protein RL768_1374 [Nitrospirota bacterium]